MRLRVAAAAASVLRARSSAWLRRGIVTSSTTPPTSSSDNQHRRSALMQRIVDVASLSRWQRPLPSLLLMWPCWWSAGLAASSGTLPPASTLATFALGAFIMRGAGCTLNDVFDRDIDAAVTRTRQRALANGRVKLADAIAFLGVQLSAGLAVLLTFPLYTIATGAASLVVVVAYPMMKRVIDWPQLVLGLAFNWGAFVGYAAIAGSCSWPVVLPLYGAGVAWTLVYDTIYAHQDKRDDERVGVRSTARLFGDKSIVWLTGFSGATLLGLAAAGAAADAGAVFYVVSVGGAAAHLAWQLGSVDLDDADDCNAKFLSNVWLGALVTAGIFADNLVAAL